jgi:hypothetical protein
MTTLLCLLPGPRLQLNIRGSRSARQSRNSRPLRGFRHRASKGVNRRCRVLQDPHSRVPRPPKANRDTTGQSLMRAHSRLCFGPVSPLSPDRPTNPQRVVRGETSPTPRPPVGSASPRDASRSARRQAARSFRSREEALLKTAPRLSTETYSATRNPRIVDKPGEDLVAACGEDSLTK